MQLPPAQADNSWSQYVRLAWGGLCYESCHDQAAHISQIQKYKLSSKSSWKWYD